MWPPPRGKLYNEIKKWCFTIVLHDKLQYFFPTIREYYCSHQSADLDRQTKDATHDGPRDKDLDLFGFGDAMFGALGILRFIVVVLEV